MEQSSIKRSRKANDGLTLIEVLIALAIIAIAMTAIIKAATENIRSTGYIQHKTIALWVAEDIMNQARIGVIHFAGDEDTSNNTVTFLGEDWHWRGHVTLSENKRIKKLDVDVFDTEDDSASPVMSLESYVYAPAP